MKIIHRTMRNKDRSIAVTHYVPEHPKASVQVLHGMAEHKDRYKEFLTYLAIFIVSFTITEGTVPMKKPKIWAIFHLSKI